MSVCVTFLQGVPNAPRPTLGPSEPLFLNISFLLLIYLALSRQQIHPLQGDRTAAVIVFPPNEEQTEERKGDVCTTKFP